MKTNTKSNMQIEEAEMVLVLSQKASIPVGYGMTYKCSVKSVKKGNLDMDSFTMTVLVGDMDQQKWLSVHSAPIEIEVGFKKGKENVPYPMMPITGFVDSNKTAWEVVYMK